MYTRCRLRLAIRIVIRTAKGAKANLPMPPKAYLVLRRYAYGALVQGSPQGRGRHHTSRAILIRLGRFLADPSGRPPLLGVYALLPLASVPFGSLLRAEVVWGPFVSASSSRLTLARPALAASLAGCSARSSLGLRAHRQPDKPTLRLGTLSCLQHFFSVLLNQRFAIDPCSPSFPILRSGK